MASHVAVPLGGVMQARPGLGQDTADVPTSWLGYASERIEAVVSARAS